MIQQIKQQNDIVRVAGQYVDLKRKGRYYVGLCPFHNDRHPSLTIDPGKQTFVCYACGAKGDIIRFVQEIEKCGCKEAIEKLSPTQRVPKRVEKKKIPPVPVHLPEGNPYIPAIAGLAGSYLDFEVMQANHHQPAAGRKMAGRIIFPVRDENGILVGYAGRKEENSLSDNDSPRYLNSPGLPRGQVLYGMHLAKKEIKQSGMICVTEGFKDAIAMHAAGWQNTVALCGTQMAEGQMELIVRYARRVLLLLDNDRAGREAAEKISRTLREKGLEVITGNLPEGDDPDSYFRREGAAGLNRLVRRRVYAPDPAETLLITALTLYPLPYIHFIRQTTVTENLPFEEDTHRQIIACYTRQEGEAFVQPFPEKEIEELQSLHGESIRKLAAATGSPEATLHYLLACYCEKRLTGIIKTLTRSLGKIKESTQRHLLLTELTHRKEQLTALSEAQQYAAAKR